MNKLQGTLIAFGAAAALTGYLAFVIEADRGEPEPSQRGNKAELGMFDADQPRLITPQGSQIKNGARLDSHAARSIAPPSMVEETLQALNADLGEEGLPVGQEELEKALRDDPALQHAMLSEPGAASGDLQEFSGASFDERP